MAGGALDYIVRMEWGPGTVAHYGPYNRASAERIAGLCNRMSAPHSGKSADVVELSRYIDPSPGSLDEPIMCRNCGERIV